MSETLEVAQLLAQAGAKLQSRDGRAALELIAQAEAQAPADPNVKMQKALAYRVSGAFQQSLEALDAALALDPYNFLALLSKGAVVEKLEGSRRAAKIYENALKLAPADDEILPNLKAPVARAREVVARTKAECEVYLREQVGQLAAPGAELARARFDEAVGIYAGTKKPRPQEPLLLHYPRLPAIPFYPRGMFPWLADLEAATDTIRGELEAALAERMDQFKPYIQFPKDMPANQWEELNHSERWSSLFLWRDGQRQDAVCEAFPKTAALLETLPLAHQPDFSPTVTLSALQARTHIPPHTGSTNVRLLAHLPLILPGPARFRVGNETREWKMGQAWVFDDTIEHEAWNDADSLRVIMIIDIWNPFLEAEERELVTAMMRARNAFYAG